MLIIENEMRRRIKAFWLVATGPGQLSYSALPLWLTNVPCVWVLIVNLQSDMTTTSACLLQNGIFCPWQQGRTFVWLFGGEGLHATTTTLLTLKWTFCLCVSNVSSKTAGQRQEQLSPRTAATIVCMFAHTCVHGPTAYTYKLCGRKCVFLCVLGKIWTAITEDIWKCQEC